MDIDKLITTLQKAKEAGCSKVVICDQKDNLVGVIVGVIQWDATEVAIQVDSK